MGDIVGVLDEVGDDFGIRFGVKDVGTFFERCAQLHKIFYDAIVYDGKLSVAVRMRVGFARSSVGRPAGMSDARRSRDGVASHFFDEIFEFSVSSSAIDFAISADGNAG